MEWNRTVEHELSVYHNINPRRDHQLPASLGHILPRQRHSHISSVTRNFAERITKSETLRRHVHELHEQRQGHESSKHGNLMGPLYAKCFYLFIGRFAYYLVSCLITNSPGTRTHTNGLHCASRPNDLFSKTTRRTLLSISRRKSRENFPLSRTDESS